MSDELEAIVARLRSGSTYDDRTDAADLIEAQEEEITRLRAELATARREGMEDAAKWHQVCAMELGGKAGLARNFRQLLRQSDFHMESAAAIRATAGEVK